MNLEKIRADLNAYINEKGLKLFELSYHPKDDTLSVILDESLKMEELEKISNELSAFLDRYDDEFADKYILDVSTVGVERPIRNQEEILQAIGSYIYVKDKDKNEYYATLLDYKEGMLLLQYLDKTRKKEVSVPYEKVRNLRYAVKF